MKSGPIASLDLIGRPRLLKPDGVDVRLPDKAYAIALFLILETKECASDRQSVADFLWPDVSVVRRAANLRTLVKRVRDAQHSAGAAVLNFGERDVALMTDEIECDVIAIRTAIETGDPERIFAAGKLIRIRMLETSGTWDVHFQNWLLLQQTRLDNSYAAAARKVLDGGKLREAPESELALANQLIAMNPVEERNYCALMRIYGARADVRAVDRTYDRLARALKKEVGCEPSEEAARLLKSFTDPSGASAERAGLREAAAASASRTEKSFKIHSKNPILYIGAENTAQSGGHAQGGRILIEEIVARVWGASVADVRVLEKERLAAALQSPGHNVYRILIIDSPGTPDGLGLRLCHAQSGLVLLAEAMQFVASDFSNFARKVAAKIVEKICDHQIESHLWLPERERPIFALIAQAEKALRCTDLPWIRRARRMFRAALQIDDSKVRAIAGLSRTFWLEWLVRAGQDPNLLVIAEEIARSGMKLQTDSHFIHRELGMINNYSRRLGLAEKHLARARALRPGTSETFVDYCDVLVSGGGSKLVIDMLTREQEAACVQDDYKSWVAASALYLTGMYREAANELALMSFSAPSARLRAACHAMLGEDEEARYYMLKTREANPDFNVKAWLRIVPLNDKVDISHVYEGMTRAGFST